MNLDSFYSYIKNPASLNNETINGLNEIIERYPYFQTARLLYLKNLQILNDYRFNDELKIVSAYAVNRKVLYELVHEIEKSEIETEQAIEIIEQIDNSTKTIDEPVIEIENKIIDEQIIESEKIEIKQSVNIIQEQTPENETNQAIEIIEQINNSTKTIDEPIIEIENKIIVPEIIAENIEVKNENVEIKQSADIVPENTHKEEINIVLKNKSVEIKKEEVSKVFVIENGKNDTSTEKPVKESMADFILKKVAAIKAQKALLNQKKEGTNKNIEIIQPQAKEQEIIHTEPEEKRIQIKDSQTDEITNQKVIVDNELKKNNLELNTEAILNLPHFNLNQTIETKLIETSAYDLNQLIKEPLKDDINVDLSKETMSFEQWINHISEKSKKLEKHKQQEQILGTFIKSEPKISINNLSENDNFDSKIKNNSIDDFTLISESLADIYAKQGLFENAIIMFEKLSLKYPEKNIYFANRILEIKSKFNNQ